MKTLTTLMALCGFMANLAAAQTAAEKPVIIGGSGAALPLIKALVQEYQIKHRSFKVRVLDPLGSAGAIKGVSEWKVDIGVISRGLTRNEESLGVATTPFARSQLVFVAHPEAKDLDQSLSKEDIIGIFTGKKSSWDDNGRINVIMLERGDSGAATIAKILPELESIFDKAWQSGIWRIEYREADALRAVDNIKNSITWSDQTHLRLLESKLKTLKYNGVEPTPQNIGSSEYPFFRVHSLVFREPADEEVEKFIQFVKSEKGLEVLRRYGAIP